MYNPYQYGQGQAYYTADGQPIATAGQAAYPGGYAAPVAYPTQAGLPYTNNPQMAYGYTQTQPVAYNQTQPAAYSQAAPMYTQGMVQAAPMYSQGAVQAAAAYPQATVQPQVYTQPVPLYTQPAVHQQPGVSTFQQPYYGYNAEQPPPPAEAAPVYPNQVSVTNEQLDAVLHGCLVNQPANPDPRKFKLPKLLRTCQYELNESKMMDVRNFYHGPVELGEAIFRAAKKDFPCATYYLGLCYMQGEGVAQKPNLANAQLWLDKAYAGSLDVTKRLAYRGLIYRRLVVLRKIHDEEFAAMVMGPGCSLDTIDLAAIFASYREYVAVKETDKQTPEVAWRSHLEEHKNMMCCVSSMFLALCYATGFGGAKNIQKAMKDMEDMSNWPKAADLKTVPVVAAMIANLAAHDSQTASPATSRALSRSQSMDSEAGVTAAKPAMERPNIPARLPVKPLAETLRATAKEFTPAPAPAARPAVPEDEATHREQPAPNTQGEASLRPWLASGSQRGQSPGRVDPAAPLSDDANAVTEESGGADAYGDIEGESHGTQDNGGAMGVRSGKDARLREAPDKVPDPHPGTGVHMPNPTGQGNRHGARDAIGSTPFAFPAVGPEAPRRGPVAARAPVPAWFTRGRSAGDEILSIVGQRPDTEEQFPNHPPSSDFDPGDSEDEAPIRGLDLDAAIRVLGRRQPPDDSESHRADALQGRKGQAAGLHPAVELDDASGSASGSSFDTGSVSSSTRTSPKKRRRRKRKSQVKAAEAKDAGGGEEGEHLPEQHEQNPAPAEMAPDELRRAVTNAMRQLTAAIEGKDRPALLDSVSLMSALLPQLADSEAMKADIDNISSAISRFEERQAEGTAAAAGREVSPDTGSGQATTPSDRTPPSAGPSGVKGPKDPSRVEEQGPLQVNGRGPGALDDPPVLPAGEPKPPPLKLSQQQSVPLPAGPEDPPVLPAGKSKPLPLKPSQQQSVPLPADPEDAPVLPAGKPKPPPLNPSQQQPVTVPAGPISPSHPASSLVASPPQGTVATSGSPSPSPDVPAGQAAGTGPAEKAHGITFDSRMEHLFPRERQVAAVPGSPGEGEQAEQPPLAAPPVQTRVARAPAPPVPVREDFPPLAATGAPAPRAPVQEEFPPLAAAGRRAEPTVRPPAAVPIPRAPMPPVAPPPGFAARRPAAPAPVMPPAPIATNATAATPAVARPVATTRGAVAGRPPPPPPIPQPVRRPAILPSAVAVNADPVADPTPRAPLRGPRPPGPAEGAARAGGAAAGGAPPQAGPGRAADAAAGAAPSHAGPVRAGDAAAGAAPLPAGPGRAGPARPALPAATPAPEAPRMWANIAKAGGPAPKATKVAEVAKPAGKANSLAQPTWDHRPVQAAQPGVQAALPEPAPEGLLVKKLTLGHDWMRRFECPMSLEVFDDPCITAEGHTYERAHIAEWLLTKDTSPSTNQPINKNVLYEDKYLKLILQKVLAHDMQRA